ncbi:MAG: helix-turn-helix transcriptional regulator [Paramuribaculum sp.]|nr:helix-turn-helix transcriptional regulator [Paramuribaculum sp.]
MRIKEVIQEKGLTINKVAELMGVNRVSLSNTINGNPTVETLQKIATALGVPVSELFEAPKEGVITCPHCGKPITIEAKP